MWNLGDAASVRFGADTIESVKLLRNIAVALATSCAVLVAAFFALNAWMVADSSQHIMSLDEVVAARTLSGPDVPSEGSAEGSAEESAASVLPADCIIAFGATVYADGTLSPILKNRVDAAIELYRQGVAPVIIMSGDGRESNYDEPSAMKAYAVAQGVPADAVYCDPGGYHTYETLWRAAHVFGATRVVLSTQEYHLFRCVFDARGLGMEALGVISDTGTYDDQLWYDVRESASRVVDFATVVFDLPPESPAEAITL